MRQRPEIMVILAVSGFALTGAVAMALLEQSRPQGVDDRPMDPIETVVVGVNDGASWFDAVRAHCNPVEVETHMRWQPAPPTDDGKMYEAACYALSGKIEQARTAIESLPSERRYEAAGVVFNAGHPAADAGDDIAAGPLMELVVDYWPNHYMALYHAGAARFDLGEYSEAKDYLERFLQEYHADDGWTTRAQNMLKEIGG